MDKLLVDGGAAWKGWDCWSETAVVGGYMEASLEVDEIGFSSLRRWADSRSSLERVGEVVWVGCWRVERWVAVEEAWGAAVVMIKMVGLVVRESWRAVERDGWIYVWNLGSLRVNKSEWCDVLVLA